MCGPGRVDTRGGCARVVRGLCDPGRVDAGGRPPARIAQTRNAAREESNPCISPCPAGDPRACPTHPECLRDAPWAPGDVSCTSRWCPRDTDGVMDESCARQLQRQLWLQLRLPLPLPLPGA